ncbi:hypothetical protein OU415_28150 [Saccharopolyspora sp. WRP15-2]|uniref:Uncharacterized protein n=1 Tax=Saccharopolyspora oryzae TaxID=2997343 RepID=A0ABT4V5U1_9PSEU|nr:hypothetical protein [Saccharopolyspora oryzae]MDA3629332.1 hypothetical protein [Saccharopolyspora oryzae]
MDENGLVQGEDSYNGGVASVTKLSFDELPQEYIDLVHSSSDLAGLSIIVHFRRARDRRWWSTFAAPGIGLLGMLSIVVLAITNFDIVAGSDAVAVRLLPLLLVLALIGGIAYSAYLKRTKPTAYDALATDLEKFNAHADQSGPIPEGDRR